jgi:hypothetical protein
MDKYRALIEKESNILAGLHRRVHATFKDRGRKLEAWKKACSDFCAYNSKMNPYIKEIYNESEYNTEDIKEFAITFLELDPMFFRSGYIKEEILRKIKRSKLNSKQVERLLYVLERAVENKGTREYRRYCRLAPSITNQKFLNYLNNVSKYGEGTRKSRAELMLTYIQQSAHNWKNEDTHHLYATKKTENQ